VTDTLGIAAAVLAAIIAMAYFISVNVVETSKQDTARITACVESGGTWLNQYQNCIGDGDE
jgi:uncharacterized protein (UPF0333 family)